MGIAVLTTIDFVLLTVRQKAIKPWTNSIKSKMFKTKRSVFVLPATDCYVEAHKLIRPVQQSAVLAVILQGRVSFPCKSNFIPGEECPCVVTNWKTIRFSWYFPVIRILSREPNKDFEAHVNSITYKSVDNPPKLCSLQWVIGCVARDGYIRDTQTGKCLSPQNCSRWSESGNFV